MLAEKHKRFFSFSRSLYAACLCCCSLIQNYCSTCAKACQMHAMLITFVQLFCEAARS